MFILFVSPPSVQYSPYQETVWPEEAVLCHCNPTCDDKEDGKRSDRWTDGALEPEAWCLVGLSLFNLIFRLKVQFSSTQRSSHLILCLYEKRFTQRDVVIGTGEILIPAASQSGPSLFRFPVRSTN